MPASVSLRRSTARVAASPVESLPESFLEQAEVCREQARDAARMKRFRAAFGLFSTAATLCRYVAGNETATLSTRHIATESLRQIDLEVSTYVELAQTVERAKAA